MAKTIVPVADLRRKPQEILPKNFDHHDLRDSQLIFNEEVQVLETKDEWVRIAAVEQLRFTPERGWHPYEGWMHQSEIGSGNIFPKFVMASHMQKLAYGTYLETPCTGAHPIPTHLDRKQLVEEAKQFLGAPYLWGGRSSPIEKHIASVDCSGLIDLLYRAQGISLPRDAHDQFLFGNRIEILQPGDPLYLAKSNLRVSHVILKLDNNFFIEAPESGKKVRLLKIGKDFWKQGGQWHFHERSHPYQGFPVSFEKRVTH